MRENRPKGNCEYCGDYTDELHNSEHPEEFTHILVCEKCEMGPVNGEYYALMSEMNSE